MGILELLLILGISLSVAGLEVLEQQIWYGRILRMYSGHTELRDQIFTLN
jgi:hypothetical protein